MPSDPITAAILGGAGIITNLFTASKAAKAAKEAAAIQVAASKRGQLYADQAHADQNALMDPYVNAGRLSLAAAQARLYGGTRESYLPKTPPPTSGPPLSGDARAIADAYQLNLGRAPSLAEIQAHLQDPNFDPVTKARQISGSAEAQAYAARQAAEGAPAQNPMSLAALQQQGPPQGSQMPQGQPMGGGPMVTLQAPDGSTKDFPAQMADQVIQQARAKGHELRRLNA